MVVNRRNNTNMIAYLQEWTTYPFTYLSNLYPQTLYSIYQKTSQERFQLIKEIVDLQNCFPGVERFYTKQELEKMKNEELRTLKESLPKESSFHEKESSFLNSQNGDNQEARDDEFLTLEELTEMYGEEAWAYSCEELQKRGVYTTNHSEQKIREEKEKLKDALITFLMEAHRKGVIYFPFSRKQLQEYPLDSLKTIYTSKVTPLKLEEFPLIEAIEVHLSMRPF